MPDAARNHAPAAGARNLILIDARLSSRSPRYTLANGWRLARRRLMGADRIEVEGPADGDTAALKRMGCIAEIVSWRTRLFAPDTATLAQIVERWPVAMPEHAPDTA